MTKKKRIRAKDKRESQLKIKREERQVKESAKENEVKDSKESIVISSIKSKTKAVGVKSVFNIGNKTGIVTSFGRGNEADVEYKLTDDEIDELQDECKLNISREKDLNGYQVTSNRIKELKGLIPELDNEPREDLLGLKAEIEKEIFGEESDDTIKIQIGYAIFDIIKILVAISSQIVYTLNSLERSNSNKDDVIGFTLNWNYPYSKFGTDSEYNENKKIRYKKIRYKTYYENAKDNFIYFNELLCDRKVEETVHDPEKGIYEVLSCVNFLRNQIVHFGKGGERFIFHSSYEKEQKLERICKLINDEFGNAVKAVNDNFVNEGNNLYLFSNAVENADYKKLAQLIYRKTVLKSDKNLGFKLKKVRELAYEKELIKHNFSVQELSSFKSKLNKIIDLTLLYYFENEEALSKDNDALIDCLRIARTDEEKEELYNFYTENLFNKPVIKEAVKRIIKAFEDKKYVSDKHENNVVIEDNWISDIKIKDNMKDFSKFIYYISRFLSGKEINILMTTLINKFQEIASFNDTFLQVKGKNVKFNEAYELFSVSAQVAEELNVIKSISKMNKPYNENYVHVLEKDVLRTLGVKEDEINEKYDELFKDASKKGLKGFIRNNVIKSGRVGYVLKYIQPSDVHEIMKNKNAVLCVLKQLPQEQLERYYKTAIDSEKGIPGRNVLQDRLLNEIIHIDYSMLADINVDPKAKKDSRDNILKEKRKALFGLYYTIVYIFVKNIVQINARYVLGFYYLERDKVLFGRKDEELSLGNSKKKYDCLTRIFMGLIKPEYKKLSKESCTKLQRYLGKPNNATEFSTEYDPLYNSYRNIIDHFNVLTCMCDYMKEDVPIDSYFQFFHYVVQRSLKELKKEDLQQKVNIVLNKLNRVTKAEVDGVFLPDKRYSKALLRAMNLPFGYTLARYKNLSYEKYFSY